jgi:hypothetical protein
MQNLDINTANALPELLYRVRAGSPLGVCSSIPAVLAFNLINSPNLNKYLGNYSAILIQYKKN